MDNTFIVRVNYNFEISSDYFIPVYYSEKYNLPYELSFSNYQPTRINEDFKAFNKYIANRVIKKYSDVDEIEKLDTYDIVRHIYCNLPTKRASGIPENYGKIPSIDELVDIVKEYYVKAYVDYWRQKGII